MVEYRYELKFEMSKQEADLLKSRLKMIMSMDPHSISDEYSYDIRSIYFDDVYHRALLEKRDGVQFRKKYRIRLYNQSDRVIKLECKHKDDDMTFKEDCNIKKQEVRDCLNGDFQNIKTKDEFFKNFLFEAKLKQLRPSVIVDYRRSAFIYPISDVRITFDENIASGGQNIDVFDFERETFPVLKKDQVVLEVKYNEFLPEHIACILRSVKKIRLAVSKFELCCRAK